MFVVLTAISGYFFFKGLSFLFADDTVLLAKGKNIEELTNFVNIEFQKIVHYFRLNKLSLHPDKTKFLIFSNVSPEFT